MSIKKETKKTYTSPVLNNYGEVKKITASGSTSKNENFGHPLGMS